MHTKTKIFISRANRNRKYSVDIEKKKLLRPLTLQIDLHLKTDCYQVSIDIRQENELTSSMLVKCNPGTIKVKIVHDFIPKYVLFTVKLF